MAYTDGITWLGDTLTGASLFGVDWSLHLIFTALTLLIISRNPNDWKIWALPVTVLWDIAGLSTTILLYMITSILFAIEVFSIPAIGQLITGTAKKLGGRESLEKSILKGARKREMQSEVKKLQKGGAQILDWSGLENKLKSMRKRR